VDPATAQGGGVTSTLSIAGHPGIDLAGQFVTLAQALTVLKASAAAIRSADEMRASLIDVRV
jgi:hypothetical protein